MEIFYELLHFVIYKISLPHESPVKTIRFTIEIVTIQK